MSESRKDQLSGFVFLAFSIFVYAASYSIKMTKADSLGPQFFPRVVSVLMGCLALLQIFGSTRKNIREQKDGAPKTEKKGFTFNLPLLLSIALLVCYYLLLKTVGFVPLTIVYLFCQMYLLFPKGALKEKKLLIISILTSVIVPFAVYYLFYYGFQIFLPAGIMG
ncbi:MAG: tripartite tricarboxylate transporter TctB family protein [Clostridia bacterium]|nr:tripartite tricarboxylate transporter TctB family protein [Clostridia bacterium]